MIRIVCFRWISRLKLGKKEQGVRKQIILRKQQTCQQLLQRLLNFIFFQFAFPDGNDFPSVFSEESVCCFVVGLIAGNFFCPPLGSGFGKSKVFAVFVSVPETSVDENDGSVFWQNDIRFGGKCFVVKSVAESVDKQKFSDQKFRFGVLASDLAHVVASCCFSEFVCHEQR